jgi:type IV secretory pathway protease TraF
MKARRLAGRITLAGGGLMAAVTLAGVCDLQPFKVNGTRSLPRGIYVRTFEPIRRGAIVWFPLPAAMRSYVAAFPGAAAWFETPANGLLKPVVGLAGDVICRGDDGVFSLNDQTLGRAPAARPDGGALPAWQGCRRLGPNELAVFSDRIPDSLDSRLYGPIAAAGAHVYRPLWTEGQ